MVPSAAQFKKLLREIYQTIPDEDPTKRERQVLISCVVASAEAVDKIEKVLKEVVGPALAALMPATTTATAPTAETAETEDAPPIHATTTSSAPAAPPPQATSISKTTTPVNGGAGAQTVSVSAPQPIARS